MKRWLAAVAAALLAEQLLRAELAERAIIDSLLAPGAHSSWLALGLGLGYLTLRLALLVGLPAVCGAAFAIVVISKISARPRALGAIRALSSSGPPGPGGRNAQEP